MTRRAKRTAMGMPDGWSSPRPLANERPVFYLFGAYFLFEVTEPAGWGYRLVSCAIDGIAQVWEMPGIEYGEARRHAELIAEGDAPVRYLGRSP